jgi:hypothetical protein
MHITGVTAMDKDVLVGPADGFFVNGVPAGPYATEQTIQQYHRSVVIVKDGARVIVGTAISPTHILTSSYWNASDAIPTNVQVVLQSGSAAAYYATVQAVIPSIRLAILTIDDDLYRFDTWIPIERDPTKILRLEGSPVIVAGADAVLGALTFHEGIVSQSNYNMFYEFTSMHVTLTTAASLTDGSIGGYVIGPEGTLLAVVQYGTPNSAYPTVIGGVRAPFISFFYDQFIASLPLLSAPLEIALPIALGEVSLLLKGRQILAQERTPLFKAGGIIVEGIVEDEQLMSMVASAGSGTADFDFSTVAYNVPALQDSILDAYLTFPPPAIISLEFQYAKLLISTTVDFTLTNIDLCTANLWNRGCPIAIPASLPSTFTLGFTSSNFILDNATDGTLSASTFVSTTLSAAFVTTQPTIGIVAHGAATPLNSATIAPAVYSAWGKYSALNTYFLGVAGKPGTAWTALGSAGANDYVFAFVTPNAPSSGLLWNVGSVPSPSTFTFTVEVDPLGLKLTSSLFPVQTSTIPFLYSYELLSFNTSTPFSIAKGLLTGGVFDFSAYTQKAGTVGTSVSTWSPVFP